MKFLLLPFLVGGFAWGQGLLQRKLDAENALQQQVAMELSNLLPEGSYAIFPSIDMETRHVRVVERGETFKENDWRSRLPDMPGFDSFGNAQPKEVEKQSYSTRLQDVIGKVTLRVILDKGLPQDLVSTAKSMLNRRIQSSFGEQSHVVIGRADLLANAKPSSDGWLGNVGEFFRKEIGWILALASLLFFLWMMGIGLARRLKSPQQQKTGNMTRDVPLPQVKLRERPRQEEPIRALPKSEDDKSYEASKDELFGAITEHPLLARRFFRQLDPQAREDFIGCCDNTAIRELLGQLLQMEIPGSKRAHAVSSDVLQKILGDFKHFRHLSSMWDDTFAGKLQLLLPKELAFLLQKHTAHMEQLEILHYIPRDVFGDVIIHLRDHEKKAIFQLLANSPRIARSRNTSIQAEISKSIDEITQRLTAAPNHSPGLLAVLLEETPDAKTLYADQMTGSPELAEELKPYLIAFGDLVHQRSDMLEKTIAEVNNETLAQALKGVSREETSRFLDPMHAHRRDIVQSLVGASADEPERIQKAQASVTRTFRKIYESHQKQASAW